MVTESQEKNVSAKSETTENIYHFLFFLLIVFFLSFSFFLKVDNPTVKLARMTEVVSQQ